MKILYFSSQIKEKKVRVNVDCDLWSVQLVKIGSLWQSGWRSTRNVCGVIKQGSPPTLQAIFDRNRKDELPRLQLEWIDSICMPLYQVITIREGLRVFPKPGRESVCTAFSEVLVLGHPPRVCVLPGMVVAAYLFLDFWSVHWEEWVPRTQRPEFSLGLSSLVYKPGIVILSLSISQTVPLRNRSVHPSLSEYLIRKRTQAQ